MSYQPEPGGSRSAFNITAPTVVKASQGVLARVIVITPPTAAGGIYDSSTTAGVSASNTISAIGTTVAAGTVMEFDWPCANGITINPGTGGVVAVSYT